MGFFFRGGVGWGGLLLFLRVGMERVGFVKVKRERGRFNEKF